MSRVEDCSADSGHEPLWVTVVKGCCDCAWMTPSWWDLECVPEGVNKGNCVGLWCWSVVSWESAGRGLPASRSSLGPSYQVTIVAVSG